ncbi:unnamed protein product [Discosporangium mesarthrocarpum]
MPFYVFLFSSPLRRPCLPFVTPCPIYGRPQAEIRSIVAKRTKFEYDLRRRQTRKLDFLRYIEYEVNLEGLRALRTKKIDKSFTSHGSGSRKPRSSDFSGVRLIRRTFDRAVSKFPGDVNLWLQYIDHAARQGSSKTLGQLFARALQLHPRNPGLWIKAASWEFFECNNSTAARVLMQRALRINRSSRNLWVQWFRLEFHYVRKLAGRRELLGLGGGGKDSNPEKEAGGEDGGMQPMDIPPVEGEMGVTDDMGPDFQGEATGTKERGGGGQGGGHLGSSGSRPAPVMNETAQSFYRGAVPLEVFRGAMEALRSVGGGIDPSFLAEFLRACTVEFPDLGGDVADAVLKRLEEEFPSSPEAWEIRASFPLLRAEVEEVGGGCESEGEGEGEVEGVKKEDRGLSAAEEAGVSVLERGVAALGSDEPEIWLRYARFLQSCLERKGRGGGRGGKEGAAGKLVCQLEAVLARAQEALGRSSFRAGGDARESGKAEEMAQAWEGVSGLLADVRMTLGRPEDALGALILATEELPWRPGPWLRRSALEARLWTLHPQESDLGSGGGRDRVRGRHGSSSEETLRQGICSVPASDPGYPELWRRLLATLVAYGAPGGVLVIERGFREAVLAFSPAVAGQEEALGEFLRAYFQWVGATRGGEGLREAMDWARGSFVLGTAGVVPALEAAIKIECALLEEGAGGGGKGKGVKRVRELFEDVVSKHGREFSRFWEAYQDFEVEHGDRKRADGLRWRARQQQM